MKKRILALLLAILTVVGQVPLAVFTAEAECTCRLENGGIHVATCAYYTCPNCGAAEWHEVCPEVEESTEEVSADYSGDVGKYVQFVADAGAYFVCDGESVPDLHGDVFSFWYEDFEPGTVLVITDWYVDAETTGLLYRVEFYSGGVLEDYAESWPADSWVLQNYLEDGWDVNALEFVGIGCSICGKDDCTSRHTYCGVCGSLDCAAAHIYCEICRGFDCGLEHELPEKEDITPPTAPLIPEAPMLPEEYDVAIVDGSGTPVTGGSGLCLGWMEKASLSAWSILGEDVFYQWQILLSRVGEDAWVNITGQNSKGILFSRAMLMNALDDTGNAWLRCLTGNENGMQASDAVCVTLEREDFGDAAVCQDCGNEICTCEPSEEDTGNAVSLLSMRTYAPSDFSDPNSGIALLNTDITYVTVTIKYLEAESFLEGAEEIPVTAPYVASIPAGTAFNPPDIIAPGRPGYAPYWDLDGDGMLYTGEDYFTKAGTFVAEGNSTVSEKATEMTLNLTADQTNEDLVFYVYYLPVKVSVGIRYFFQNTDNDNYTEDVGRYHADWMRTGTIVDEAYLTAHAGNVEGFSRMYHQSEPVAADGSTVFECYYDRSYYLIYLALGGGYGVEPIYARYETPISVGIPIRAGYEFKGWDQLTVDTDGDGIPDAGDGQADGLPASVPAENLHYAAIWAAIPGGSSYTVVYWRENADPNSDGTYGYSLWGTVIHTGALAGERVSGEDDIPTAITRITLNNTTVDERNYFTYNDFMTDKNVEVKGDGSTVVNVYYTRNSYTIKFTGYGKCYLTNHTHGIGCNTKLTCALEEHTHTDCGAPTLSCGRQEHTTHTDGCLACDHTVHTLDCFKPEKGNYARLQEISKPNDPGTTTDGYIYTSGTGQKNYYLYVYGKWYCVYEWWVWGYVQAADVNITLDCTHEHTTACYKDTLHTHADGCYTYSCGKQIHTHTDACYSACTLIKHTHSTTCENNTSNVVYAITAKYDADISAIWPTYDVLKNYSTHYKDSDGNVENNNNRLFVSWSNLVSGMTVVSKRVTMTYDLCDTSDGEKTATAGYNNATIKRRFYYMFESIDQTSGEVASDPVTGAARRQYNGTWYDSDPAYYQELMYSESDDFNQKTITGMTSVGVKSETMNGVVYNYLYYNRSSHVLKFQSQDEVVLEETVKYGADLKNYAYKDDVLLEPDYPSNLEADAYEFAGWYTTAEFIPGTEADEAYFNSSAATMPNSDMVFFAKWAPVIRTVNFFCHYEYLEAYEKDNTATSIELGDQTITFRPGGMKTVTLYHGETLSEYQVPTWTYQLGDDNAELVGWFYIDDGQKKAYSPEDIPVRDDLNVYAEWRGEEDHPFLIRYVLKTDPTVEVAEPTKGYSRIGVLRTFSAKAGAPYNQLYPAYNEGYFPTNASHSVVVQSEENPDVAVRNIFSFEYVQVTNVNYKVYYVDAETGTQLAAPKTMSTEKAVVSESYVYIDGYIPDAFYKQLILSVKEDDEGNYVGDDDANVIIFKYTKNTVEALYAVHYMVQTLTGDPNNYAIDGSGGYEQYGKASEKAGKIDELVTIIPAEIAGFKHVRGVYLDKTDSTEVVQPTGSDGKYTMTVTAEGAHLYIFYQRLSYGYTVNYYKSGTTESVIASKLGTAVPFGDTVSETALLYTDDKAWRLVSEQTQTIEIRQGDSLNVINFYYDPIQYKVDYIAVTGEGGRLTPVSQEVLTSANFQGATPVANPNYKFAGWYLDETCTVPAGTGVAIIDSDNHLTPKWLEDADGNPVTEYTFYAKFELQAGDFTINRTNARPGQVFAYRVEGGGLRIDVTVVTDENGKGSVIVANLPYGSYTVTQLNDWSWRYTDEEQTVDHDADTNCVAFQKWSAVKEWLNGISTLVSNKFS